MKYEYSPIDRSHVMERVASTKPSYTGLLEYLYDRPADDINEVIQNLPPNVLKDLHSQEVIDYNQNTAEGVEPVTVLSALHVAGLMLRQAVLTRQWERQFGEDSDPVLAD